jgi:hypothetical protein
MPSDDVLANFFCISKYSYRNSKVPKYSISWFGTMPELVFTDKKYFVKSNRSILYLY